MLSQSAAMRGHQRTIRAADGLKSFLLNGLVAAVLALGIGLTIAGATAAVLGLTAGGLGAASASCQRVEINLAGDLGLSAPTLRLAGPATLAARVAAQRDAGALTPIAADRAADRVEAYVGCRSLLLHPASAR